MTRICVHGTNSEVQNNTAQLRNVPFAHLATGQAQGVPICHPGTFNCEHAMMSKSNMVIHIYCILLCIFEPPPKTQRQTMSVAAFLPTFLCTGHQYIEIILSNM